MTARAHVGCMVTRAHLAGLMVTQFAAPIGVCRPVALLPGMPGDDWQSGLGLGLWR